MKTELRRRVLDKFESQIAQLAAPFLGEEQGKQWAKSRFEMSGQKKLLEAKLRRMPDREYGAMMSTLDVLDPKVLGPLAKKGLSRLPKSRGGRKGNFSLEERQKAIQDVGTEYARCDSLREAFEVVASRYKMPVDYLRRVWKNRKRLRPNEGSRKTK